MPAAFIPSVPRLGIPSSNPFCSARRPRHSPTRLPSTTRRVRTVACNRDAPFSSASSIPQPSPPDDDTSEPPASASRTLVGRALVEVLSLIVGAALLLVVVLWRASHVVSLTAWRAVVWVSNLRRLGKWAFSRVVTVGGGVFCAAREAVGAVLPWVPRRRAGGATEVTVGAEEVPVEVEREYGQGELELIRELIDVEESVKAEAEGGRGGGVGIATGTRRLVLVRHAKTMWDRESEIPDHDRVLSGKGKEEARLVGAELGMRAWVPDVVLCSDAVRTVQTLGLLQVAERKAQRDTLCTDALYYAVTGEEMAVAVDEALGGGGIAERMTLLVVCHNPGCEELVEQLTGERAEMGTACAALLEWKGEGGDVGEKVLLAAKRNEWRLVEVLRPAALAGAARGRVAE